MTDSQNITVPSVDELKRTVLPVLFLDARAISHYGDSAVSTGAMDRYSSMMEKDAITGLSGTLSSIASALVLADPHSIASNPSWLSRFTGKHLETQVRYQNARQEVEILIIRGENFLKHVNDILQALEELLEIYQTEIHRLNVYIQAGREYLEDSSANPMSEENRLVFDNQRELFARKVEKLSTLLTSHEMTEMQMKMTQAQCIDMVGRFYETTTVLVPEWRRHTLSLITMKNMVPSFVKQTTSGHGAFLSGLHKRFETVYGEEMIHEISAIAGRTEEMKICGSTVGGIGLLAAIVGIGGLLCSLIIGPSATIFDIDIPAALIPLQSGFKGIFGSIADSPVESLRGLIPIMPGLIGLAALAYIPYKLLKMPLVLILIIFFGAVYKFLPAMHDARVGLGQENIGTISTESKVSDFLRNHETEKLLDYLKSVSSDSPDQMHLINYVAAQASIIDGKPNVTLAKMVVDTYKNGTSATDIPVNIRYALEMAAFSKAVTPPALNYEEKKNALARQYSDLGKSTFYTGGGLALIGLLILVWVRRLNQRIQFLSMFAIR